MREKILTSRISSRHSQVTIFVIIAIVLVIAIIGVFFVTKKPAVTYNNPEDAQKNIEDCLKNKVTAMIEEIYVKGGIFNSKKSTMFGEANFTILCYTPEFGKVCINEHPMLNKEIEAELLAKIKPEADKCFLELSKILSNYNYRETGSMASSIAISSGTIALKLNKQIDYMKNEKTISVDNFNMNFNSPITGFIKLTGEIINQEVNCKCGQQLCGADLLKLSMSNRDYEITKQSSTTGERIYYIRELATNKNFNFAVRSCISND